MRKNIWPLGDCEQITINAEAAEAAATKYLKISLRAPRSNVAFFHKLFSAAAAALVISSAGHVSQLSAQEAPYQPPAKRVSPQQGFARQKSSLPTPRSSGRPGRRRFTGQGSPGATTTSS